MMKWIWGGLLIFGIVSAMLLGDPEAALSAGIAGAADAVTLVVSLLGTYILWMGLMNVAKDAGLIDAFARAVHKPIKAIFPGAKASVAPITLTFAANFLGLGSAATPFGLAAMKELKQESQSPERVASNNMVMFLALNSSAVELLPTGVLALRAAAGSQNIYAVVIPTFLASVASFAAAYLAAKCFEKWFPENNL